MSGSRSLEHSSLCIAGLYFVAVATVAAFTGQHVVRRIIVILGRASLIIFILAFTIFVSAISLGKSSSRIPTFARSSIAYKKFYYRIFLLVLF